MYLHKDDKELLRDIIVTVSERMGIDEKSVVENSNNRYNIEKKTNMDC